MAKNQNRIRNRWELITCGLGGHVTYAPDDSALAARLRASTGLGEVWRCLRCGDFALGGPQGRGAPEDAPLIMRGKAFAQICASFDIPWLVIRALSDLAGADSGVDFNRFVGEVAASSARVLLRLLPVLTAC